ncbi:hypothetical protein CKAN_00379400 [Cinnamomum micranthum f. kanehirae]|uniref:Uncharacterized protein n=1 Tax=Cinnamomum micranthum f. kanehirae TaxID=337451 RepID=A0A3S3MKK6_9MAGN|nr:hypothetical protein CKAN_00379400 [Cinnamomum micranthum f. kanehirae]
MAYSAHGRLDQSVWSKRIQSCRKVQWLMGDSTRVYGPSAINLASKIEGKREEEKEKEKKKKKKERQREKERRKQRWLVVHRCRLAAATAPSGNAKAMASRDRGGLGKRMIMWNSAVIKTSCK